LHWDNGIDLPGFLALAAVSAPIDYFSMFIDIIDIELIHLVCDTAFRSAVYRMKHVTEDM